MLLLFLGCNSSSKDSAEPFVPLVSVDVQILDAMTGVKSGVVLTTEHSSKVRIQKVKQQCWPLESRM